MSHKVGLLPPVFAQYTKLVRCIQKTSESKWTSSCPVCGGDWHQEPGRHGEPSDRCIWFLDTKPLGWCARCQQIFWPDASPDWTPPTSQQMETWRQKEEHIQQQRKEAAERALAYLRSQKPWEQWHDAMNGYAHQYWENRGLSRFWQDWWQLGWDSQRTFSYMGEPFLTDVATLPIFGLGWTPINVKMRLQTYPSGAGKYRYHLSRGSAPLFLCNPDLDLSGEVIAVEGEIKSAVVYSVLQDSKIRIIGLPGTNPGKEALKGLADCERIVLVMDPGSDEQAHKLAAQLGKERCRILVTPVKIDDGILAGNLNTRELRGLLRSAVPA